MSEKSTLFARRLSGYAGAGLFSKVLGYARDAAIMAVFGSGRLTDAYYAAFRVINLFRRTVGEGSLNAAFIPAMEREKAAGPEKALRFFHAAFTVMMLTSVTGCVIGMVFSQELVKYTSYGFTRDPGQFRLTVILTALLMPHIVFVAASALLTAALNVSRKFFVPALAPSVFSICVIAYALALRSGPLAGLTPEHQVMGLALVASGSGLVQAGILWVMASRAGFTLRFAKPFAAGGPRRSLAMLAPAAAVAAQDQLSLLIITFFASFLEAGAVTAIYNSARLIQFPVSLFAASCAAVTLPDLSGSHARGALEDFRETFSLSLRTTLLIMLPATAGLMVLALPVTRTLFEHGRFTFEQSSLTAGTLFCLSAGITGYGVNKLAASALYAMGAYWSPLKLILGQLALNAALCALLVKHNGARGLTLATSISSLLAAGGFLYLLSRRLPGLLDRSLGLFALKCGAAALLMAALCLPAARLLAPAGPATVTAVCVPLGAAVYLASLKWLGVAERASLFKLFRK